jgi:hypothetical protein
MNNTDRNIDLKSTNREHIENSLNLRKMFVRNKKENLNQ